MVLTPGKVGYLGSLFAAQAPPLRAMPPSNSRPGRGSRRFSRTRKPDWRDRLLGLDALKGDILALR